MKKISFYPFALALVMLFLTACEKDRAFPEYADIGHGAFPRMIDGINGAYGNAFNFFDVDGSSINFTVEFYDDTQGKSVSNYSWTVEYSGGAGPAQIASVDASSFGTSPDGLPSTSFTFSFQEVLNVLGLTIDDVEGGEKFEFQATLTRNDGTTFTSRNTDSNVQSQPPFRGTFQISTPIICPSELEGTFDAVTVAAGPWGCTDTWEGTVTWEHQGNGVYLIYAQDDTHDKTLDFSMGAYWVCYGTDATLPSDEGGPGDLALSDACGTLSFTGASRWGEIYTFNSITVDGASVTLDWINDYGEAGVTTLTRTDGKDWPPLKP